VHLLCVIKFIIFTNQSISGQRQFKFKNFDLLPKIFLKTILFPTVFIINSQAIKISSQNEKFYKNAPKFQIIFLTCFFFNLKKANFRDEIELGNKEINQHICL